MTAITDANTFIDQNLINVPYQGVPATTLNACLKTITNVFNSYATIASVNSLFGYALDENFPAALMNASNQAFTLNGGYVSISALLLFSSGQKYTVGPDGNYILNAANGPAWDWSTGRRRLLIEAIGATNYWANSENGAAWTIVEATPTVVSNALFGILSLTTLTANSTSWARAQETKSVNAGDIVTFSGAAVAGNKTTATIYIAGSVSGNGLASQVVPTVKSGPGTIAADTTFGSIRMWRVNDLSASVPTEFAFTMTCPSTETITVQIGVGVYTGGASGDSAKFGRLQLEPGYGSSYTPCGASSTARAADVVTAASGLLSLLQAENAAFVMRGQVLTPVISYSRLLSGTSGAVLISARSSDPAVATIGYIQQGANSPSVSAGAGNMLTGFGICGAINGSQAKLAFNGGAVSTTLDSFAGVLSSVSLFGAGTSYPVNGFLDELVEWPIWPSDAGLQAQARVYS